MPSLLPPASNRLSSASSSAAWGGPRDSLVAMQQVVSAEDLSVVFQPIVSLEDGGVFAYEALVRCRLPRLAGNPALLVEEAANLRCVGRLGRMIREIAIPLCSGIPVFLNVHPQELIEGWLVRPDDPIFAHDHDVYIEITESVPLTHHQLCATVLNEVRSRAGAHLVVDDLGAGYSNLKRILDLEPAIVKLDRELVTGIDRNPRQRQLMSSLVRLCDELHARVVVEGVETLAELTAVQDTGAQFGQGFLMARPGFPLPLPSWPPLEDAPAEPQTLRGA